MEEDEEIMTLLDSVVTGELTIPTVVVEFAKEAPEEAEEVPGQLEVPPMGGSNRYLFLEVGRIMVSTWIM